MENFKSPNFELVADLLFWLVNRFDHDFELAEDIEEESDRIAFVKNVATFFLSKARIRLNMKKIYQADGYAVQEMLKLANMLYKAITTSNGEEDESSLDFGASSKL
jgi:clusterin-associated protein 1